VGPRVTIETPSARTASPTAAVPAPNDARLEEDEVYGALGALLGTLEVLANDDAYPLAPVQREHLGTARRLGRRLEQQLDALLLLAAEDTAARVRMSRRPLRPLVEHALRGAVRGLADDSIALALPEPATFGELCVHVDASRVDRMLTALTEALADRVGAGGAIALTLEQGEREVALSLHGTRADRAPRRRPPYPAALIERAARSLLSLHGGSLRCSLEQLVVQVTLPLAESL
jgi:hypothetical protein